MKKTLHHNFLNVKHQKPKFTRIQFFVFFTLLLVSYSFHSSAQSITVTGYINGLKHQYNCGNDGTLGDNPHPRWQFWFGYDGSNFTAVSDNGGTTYKPGGRQACNDFNPGAINLPTKTGAMNYVNMDMSSWEEDENFTPACDQNDNAANNGGFFCVNADDNYFSRKTISDPIYFWNNGPCSNVTYTGAFNTGSFLSTHGRGGTTGLGGTNNGNDDPTNAGNYGINQLILNWQLAQNLQSHYNPTLCRWVEQHETYVQDYHFHFNFQRTSIMDGHWDDG